MASVWIRMFDGYTSPSCRTRASPLAQTKMFSLGIPTSTAVAAWSLSILYSPCTGIKYLGLISWSISFCSSHEACPVVCRDWKVWFWITLAPFLTSLFTMPETFNALPGIGLDESRTVSPGIICTNLWVLFAILERAASCSPCDPVQTIHNLSASVWLTRSGEIKVSSGTSIVFILRPISTTFSIERPKTQTFRPHSLAALIICERRCTFEAKVDTISLFGVFFIISIIEEATCFSLMEKPGTSEFVESDISNVTPAAPI